MIESSTVLARHHTVPLINAHKVSTLPSLAAIKDRFSTFGTNVVAQRSSGAESTQNTVQHFKWCNRGNNMCSKQRELRCAA